MKKKLITFAILVSAQSALAQPDPVPTDPAGAPEPPPDPVAAPPPPPPPTTTTPPPPPGGEVVAVDARKVGVVLPNMLPDRIGATVDIRGDYTHSDEGGLFGGDDVTLLGFTLWGQYLTAQGYGGYVQLPYYYVSAGDNSDKGIGNLEVGGLYRIPNGESSVILLRGGFALDTAGQAGAFGAPFSQLAPRLYDAYPTGLESTWLRAEGSFRHNAGDIFLGVAGAIDVPLGGGDEFDEIDALGKVAGSVGFRAGTATFAVGLVNLTAIGSESDDDNILGANVTAAFDVNPSVAVYGAFGYPDLEDNELDLFGIGIGVRIAAN
jgi:hypothetical protein